MSSRVDHPDHYQTESGIEAIEVIEAFFPDSFHLGNVFKYLARAGRKATGWKTYRKPHGTCGGKSKGMSDRHDRGS